MFYSSGMTGVSQDLRTQGMGGVAGDGGCWRVTLNSLDSLRRGRKSWAGGAGSMAKVSFVTLDL